MIKMLLSCGFFLTAVLLFSCQRKAIKPAAQAASANPGPSADSNPQSDPEPFTLSLAGGGGFTGRYSGFTLASDGTVKQWERSGAGADSTLWETRIPAGRIIDFRRRLEQGGALGISLQESGNMTTSVKLGVPDTVHLWSWPGAGVSESVPEPFRSWYPEVLGFCENLKSATLKDPDGPHGK